MATKKTKTNSKPKAHIHPLGDRVLLKPLSEEDLNKKSTSGIILPETLNKERPEQGTVLAVGGGKTTDSGELIPLSVKKGDRVIFSKFGPDEVTVEGEEYLIVSESNILAVIE
jgi:chaperonin GroES